MNGKMNIFYIVESGGMSGGVRVIFEHATRLKLRGHDVVIASLDKPPGWFDLGDVGWWTFQDYSLMDAELRKKRGKKIATWWKTAPIVKNVSAEGEGYYFIQDIETSYYWRPQEKADVMSTYQYPLKHFTEDKWVADMMPGTFNVGQAIDTTLYRKLPYMYPTKKRALSVVRRQALKGYSDLCEFSRRLCMIDREAELVTFGQDPYVSMGGAFRGHMRNITDAQVVRLYSEGSVYVCASLHEGFGLPLLEAMACGCPVATTSCDGNYFCINEVNSLVVPRGEPKALAEAAYRIMTDEVLRKKLIAGGLETAKAFSDFEPVIDRLEEFWQLDNLQNPALYGKVMSCRRRTYVGGQHPRSY